MAKARITKSFADDIAAGNRDQFIYDDALTGFGLKVTPRGRKVFIFEYRYGQRSQRYSIGRYGDWTVHTARKEAERLRGMVRSGLDPASEKRAARIGATMSEALAEFDARHIAKHLKPNTARGYRQIISLEVLPALGRHKVRDIEPRDISRLHNAKPTIHILPIVSLLCCPSSSVGARRKPCARSDPTHARALLDTRKSRVSGFFPQQRWLACRMRLRSSRPWAPRHMRLPP